MFRPALIGALLIAGSFVAQEPPVGAAFLLIWPGARPTALAGAFTAVADDPFATYFNPGGLAFAAHPEVSLTHSPWLSGLYPGMFYEFLGAVHPLGRGAVGLGASFLNLGATEVIDNQGDLVRVEQVYRTSVGPAYGLAVTRRLGLGLGVKFIYSNRTMPYMLDGAQVDPFGGGTGASVAVDAGLLYRPLTVLAVGAALANLGPPISYQEFYPPFRTYPLPATFRLAIRYEPVNTRLFRFFVTPELTKVLVGMFHDPADTLTTFQEIGCELYEAWKGVGLELCCANMISLRVGLFSDPTGLRGGIARNEAGRIYRWPFTYGGGIRYRGFRLDIGFDNLLYNFTTTDYRLSLSYTF